MPLRTHPEVRGFRTSTPRADNPAGVLDSLKTTTPRAD
uniref:Uncharacterized protein n=1 Tax=Anguilla anguilla TaxID=7936 RepID=A0A0E9XS71_ANGAN